MLASWEVGAKREGGSVRGVCVCLYTCVCMHSHERGVVSSLGPRAPLERSAHTLKF